MVNRYERVSTPGTHNSLMGTENQEAKLQEITAKTTRRIRGGEDLNKLSKEDSAFQTEKQKKALVLNALVTVYNTYK